MFHRQRGEAAPQAFTILQRHVEHGVEPVQRSRNDSPVAMRQLFLRLASRLPAACGYPDGMLVEASLRAKHFLRQNKHAKDLSGCGGMELLAQLVAHPAVIGGVVAGLVGWAAWSAWRLTRGVQQVCDVLDRARQRLEEAADAESFLAIYERVAADLAALPLLGPRWRDYRETLLISTDAGTPVRSTSRPELWFDTTALLRAAGLAPRYHAALPNLLVGAGLLFLGLALALGDGRQHRRGGCHPGRTQRRLAGAVGYRRFQVHHFFGWSGPFSRLRWVAQPLLAGGGHSARPLLVGAGGTRTLYHASGTAGGGEPAAGQTT
jgi:hypothetical protein